MGSNGVSSDGPPKMDFYRMKKSVPPSVFNADVTTRVRSSGPSGDRHRRQATNPRRKLAHLTFESSLFDLSIQSSTRKVAEAAELVIKQRTAEELGLRRVKLLNAYPFEGLEEHTLLMKSYGRLWEVGSVEAFQDVFVDCLECHYHAYTDAKVLHRDLSENNLMFKRTDDTSDGKIKGILNDWDMASGVEANDEILPSTATHRTGTIPFMAIDLLVVNRRPPPHLFRHDLESFFYILIWAAFYYDFDKKERRSTEPSTQPPLERWNNADLKGCANSKMAFLFNSIAREQLLALVPPENQSLLPWMRSVWLLFSKANVVRGTNFDTPEAGWDDKTLGGFLTFEKFMEALGRKPRHQTSSAV
ncbi:hypothetical protein D9615_003853 [Tricholomella constricta]|uniref:Fungal-type protein kinase domain-containing protein n=1 Tax=Tricholomella constricta TaxID=117010 RepID=A0A8H5HHX8_9AGAR|nr:hypothetical protein D9615_003853 [Tricholomella constricta]